MWREMSDAELWSYTLEHDTLVNVGLKAPGARRGIWRDQRLVNLPGQAEGRRAIEAIRGLEVVNEIAGLPAVQVHAASEDALGQLRALPFADYVEPNALGGGYSESSGCAYNNLTPQNPAYTFAGDVMPPYYTRSDVQVHNAWNRASGEGVVLGLTVTGISDGQAHLLSRFDEDYSAGRWYSYRGVGELDWRETSCSHGTRMAGVMAAPMNGANMAGVAWGANLVSAHQADAVTDVNGAYAANAIEIAAADVRSGESPSNHRIVTMAWHSFPSSTIADKIRDWYAQGRLFIGASGTVDLAGISFPAEMPEVVAVSAVDPNDYSGCSNLNYGSEVELTFPVDQLSHGEFTPDYASLGGTSGATAAVSGIAALVWSAYPNDSHLDIRQRLREAGHIYPNHNRIVGYGVPNAMEAVGGMWDAYINEFITSGGGFNQIKFFDLEAFYRGGDGPYTYLWDTGETSKVIQGAIGPGEPSQNYGVTITDHADGTTQYAAITVDPPPGGCDDPSDIYCS
jgi:subtilisin family serine protease